VTKWRSTHNKQKPEGIKDGIRYLPERLIPQAEAVEQAGLARSRGPHDGQHLPSEQQIKTCVMQSTLHVRARAELAGRDSDQVPKFVVKEVKPFLRTSGRLAPPPKGSAAEKGRMYT